MASDADIEESFEERSEKVFKRIEYLATPREQSVRLLTRRLIREGYEEDAVEEAVRRALQCSLIDDDRYASVLIRSRLSSKKGVHGVKRELEELEMNQPLNYYCPEISFDDDRELERALEVLALKPPTSKNKREGAYRKLISKGYESTIASRASRLWCEENNVF